VSACSPWLLVLVAFAGTVTKSTYGPPELVLLATINPVSLVELSVQVRLICEALCGVAVNPLGVTGRFTLTSLSRGGELLPAPSRETICMPSGCVSPSVSDGSVRSHRGSCEMRNVTSELVQVRMKSVTSICCSRERCLRTRVGPGERLNHRDR